jgi:hypothetical protein
MGVFDPVAPTHKYENDMEKKLHAWLPYFILTA